MSNAGTGVVLAAVPFLVSNIVTAAQSQSLRTGKDALGDWSTDAPGVWRKILAADLPPPNSRESTSNGPRIISRPPDAELHVPPGFKIEQIASGLRNPRFLLTAPNGDIFISESRANQLKVMHADGRVELFADSGLNDPFGLAFYPPGNDPQFLYVANTNGIIRFPYRSGDARARAPAEKLSAELSGGGLLHGGGHWTRDIVFAPDGNKYVRLHRLALEQLL